LDRFSTDASQVIPTADIVVLSVPVQHMRSLAARIIPLMKKGAVLTDVGSVKGLVEKEIHSLLRKRLDLTFIGGHPLAGSEKFGVDFAERDLFKGALCVLTFSAKKNKGAAKVKKMWQDVGARCVKVNARRHDAILALTSHLPHLLAFTLFSEALSKNRKDSLTSQLSAGSFRDMTRIVASEPALWAGIVSQNKSALRQAVQVFIRTLQKSLRLSPKEFESWLGNLSRIKRSWDK
jgi:prephenate dehydrogenase